MRAPPVAVPASGESQNFGRPGQVRDHSEGDLLRFVVGTRHEPAGSPRTVSAAYRQDAYRHVVADVMTRNPVTATEPLSVEDLARLFVRLPWRMLPVVRLGRLVGVVTRTDVVHALVGSNLLASPG